MQYVPNTAEINAFQTFVVPTDGSWVSAKALGGRASRSGLTWTPTWIEAGAVVAYRMDAVCQTVLNMREESIALPAEIPVFSGHGMSVTEFSGIEPHRLLEVLAAWKAFRESGGTPPTKEESLEFTLARRATNPRTRASSGYLTYGEAIEGLPSRDSDSILNVGEGFWTISVPGRGDAIGCEEDGATPTRFLWRNYGEETRWNTPEGIRASRYEGRDYYSQWLLEPGGTWKELEPDLDLY